MTGPAAWVRRRAERAILPGDDEALRQRKALFVAAGPIAVAGALVWTLLYAVLGRPLAAAVPFGYAVLAWGSLVWLDKRPGGFLWLLTGNLVLVVLLPFALQWSLGGMVSSGLVSLWALIGPLAALIFLGVEAAVPWLLSTLLLAFGFDVGDWHAAVASLPLFMRDVFFFMNAGMLSAFVVLLTRHFLRERERARRRSEELLLNILPAPIAMRLKECPDSLIAVRHESVTVVFADLVGFTALSAELPPETVVDWLNELFSRFDDLTTQWGLEKIKTIGDAYMVVAGVPDPQADHVERALKMACAMVRETAAAGRPLALRVGVDTGPVVAGVIGRRKFSYDLWGDTVNMASRMEANGLPNRIQVTERVWRAARHRYRFSARPEVPVKGKGIITAYLLESGPDGTPD